MCLDYPQENWKPLDFKQSNNGTELLVERLLQMQYIKNETEAWGCVGYEYNWKNSEGMEIKTIRNLLQ